MIFAALPERLSNEEIEEMLEASDEDGKHDLNPQDIHTHYSLLIAGNGRIDYEEFKLMLGHCSN